MSGLLTWGLSPGAPPLPTGDSLKTVVVSALGLSTDLASVVGSRIYPTMIPQSAGRNAALSYRFPSATRVGVLTGAGGMKSVRVRFEVRSALVSEVETVFELVRNLFQGLPGTLGSIAIHYVSVENEEDSYAPPLPGSDLGLHSKAFDLLFKLNESLPTNS